MADYPENGIAPASAGEGASGAVADGAQQWMDALAAADLLDGNRRDALGRAVAEARAGRLESPPAPLLTVLLLGATGGGKSALLNALAGAEIARSHHLRPTTSQPTVYLHEEISPARLFEYGPQLAHLVQTEGAMQPHSRSELRHKVVIDAPDIDSYRTAHRDTVLGLLPVVDVVLYVVTPFSYKDDIGWEIIQRERGRRAFAFVMNKWDSDGMPRAGDGQDGGPAEDFRRMIEQRAGYSQAHLFFTSARSHLPATPGEDPPPTPAPGENFAELKQWLEQGLSTSHIEQIQRRRRRSLWGALAAAVAGALPGKFDENGVQAEITAALADLPTEGKAAWAVAIERRAEATARRREEEARPHSPGPFGRLSALFSAMINAGTSWRKLAEPRPDITLEELDVQAQRSSEIASSRLSHIERILRSHQIPALQIHHRLESISSAAGPHLRSTFQAQSESILESLVQRWRMGLGWAVLVIFELLAVGLFGLAAWRLVQAFLLAQYLDLKFTLNLLALLVLLLSAGSALMALLFPPVKNRIRRQLAAAVVEQWEHTRAEALAQTAAYLAEIRMLREEGAALLARCNAEIAKLSEEISAVDEGETDRLFAQKP